MGKLLLFAFLLAFTAGLVLGAAFPSTVQFTHMDEPCDPNERCPLHPDAVCKLDCLIVDENGRGNDCIYNFYDENDNIVVCWFL